MKRSARLVLSTLLLIAVWTLGAAAFDTSNLNIPANAEAIVYGQSGASRNLTAYRFGTGKNVMVVGFSIHGYEDNWSKDGGALVYTAGQLMDDLDQNVDLLVDYDWSIYVLPCMNPDGLIDGYTNDGPGRCTTTYITKSGYLTSSRGIDLNRSFPTGWTQYTSSRNYNGSMPLASQESRALASFVKSVKGSSANICIDTHGWMSQIITSNGTSSSLYKIFRKAFPYNTWANCNNGRGYLTAYTANLGYASCLFEFPDGIYSLSGFTKSGYCERYCGCILSLMKAYGSYNGHSLSCPSRKFTDVGMLKWYHSSVDYVLSQGLFNGVSDVSFAPDMEMSRAMLVTTLWRMAGSPEPEAEPEPSPSPSPSASPEPSASPSPSVSPEPSASPSPSASPEPSASPSPSVSPEPSASPSPSVSPEPSASPSPSASPEPSASPSPSVSPEPSASPSPSASTEPSASPSPSVSPEPSASPSPSASPEPSVTPTPELPKGPGGFTDTAADQWYTKAVIWAKQNGIVTGYPDSTFRPNGSVSRQELAAIVCRFANWEGRTTAGSADLSSYPDCAQISDFAVSSLSWACAEGLIQGIPTDGSTLLLPAASSTRAQVAAILMRYCQNVQGKTAQAMASGPSVRVEPNYYDGGDDLDGN